jgi:hypothetical protein
MQVPHNKEDPCLHGVLTRLDTIETLLNKVLKTLQGVTKMEIQIMGDTTALQAAMDKMVADVAAGIAKINDLLAQIVAASGDQASIDALTAEAMKAAADLEAAIAPPA